MVRLKSRAGTRTVSLPPSTVELIRERVQDARAHGGFVFHQVTNTQKPIWYNNFSERFWNPAVERAGLPVRPTPHDLRHSHASGLIAQGIPLPVIQRRLGHESIQTTVDVYGHLAPDAHVGAAEAVERIMSNVLPVIEA